MFSGDASDQLKVNICLKSSVNSILSITFIHSSICPSHPHTIHSPFIHPFIHSFFQEEFRLHFRNISRIMDCVGCDKCRLWGTLQIRGIGTALKILFNGRKTKQLYLSRSEVVSLFNVLGRYKIFKTVS